MRFDLALSGRVCLTGMALAMGSSARTEPAVAASAPHAIHVGDGTADGLRLRPYNNAWLFSASFPDRPTRVQGIWSDHLEAVEVGGRSVLKRVQGMTYINGISQSVVNVFDPSTCAPISSEAHRPNGQVIRRQFNGTQVTSEWPAESAGVPNAPAAASAAGTSGNPSRTVAFETPEPAFDFFGGMYGLLLSCFR